MARLHSGAYLVYSVHYSIIVDGEIYPEREPGFTLSFINRRRNGSNYRKPY